MVVSCQFIVARQCRTHHSTFKLIIDISWSFDARKGGDCSCRLHSGEYPWLVLTASFCDCVLPPLLFIILGMQLLVIIVGSNWLLVHVWNLASHVPVYWIMKVHRLEKDIMHLVPKTTRWNADALVRAMKRKSSVSIKPICCEEFRELGSTTLRSIL